MGFKDAAKPHYLGHRERLRRRFRDGGPDALPDYELLELVLFRAMPRRDTKPLAKAILAATAIVLVHNHPSGDPTPSRADIEMTKQIVAVAKPLGVVVYDHIIVGKQGHTSFRGLGLI